MKAKIFALSALLAASLTACGTGTWVDVPGIAGGCEDGKPNGLGITSAEDVKLVGQGMCATRQKNYAGDFQCKGDDLQVKCN